MSDVLRRSIVLPHDLYVAVARVVPAHGFANVQGWAVCRLQAIVNERPETRPPGLVGSSNVARHPLSLSRSLLQFSSAPPALWTVVQDTGNAAAGVPAACTSYAVCPNCRRRVPLTGSPATMRCPGCNGLFEVAWDEAASLRRLDAQRRHETGGVDGPQADRRMARCRLIPSRRLLVDRRFADRRRASARVSRGRRRMIERRQGLDRRTLLDRRQPVRQ